MELLLISSLIVVIYCFIGYPILLIILSTLKPRKIMISEENNLTVSIIIAAYNEENIIEEKIKNTLDLDYPNDRFEIIVASDASTDRTDEIVRKFKNKDIILFRREGRIGKTDIQNQAVNIAKGDIIIFSDANALYDRDAIKKIVRNFSDDHVGGVCGNLLYMNFDQNIDVAENLYWKYEKYLKEMESALNSVLGANGSIYAVRRNLYVPLPPNLISDFVEPLKIVEQGYRVVYEKEAISREDIKSVSGDQAFKRKVRINRRTIGALIYSLDFLGNRKNTLLFFQLISHKVLRYLMPFVLIVLYLLNIFVMNSILWKVCFSLQSLFYLLSFIGYLQRSNSRKKNIFYFPWYFVWTHIAILVGWFQFIKGDEVIVWETQSR